MRWQPGNKPLVLVLFLGCAVVLSLLTVYVQEKKLGLAYLEQGDQVVRLNMVLQDKSYDPWQYRILSEYLVQGLLFVVKKTGVPHPLACAFLAFRLFQNTLIFLLAAVYYRKLGLGAYVTLIGLSLLAWSMTHSLFDSDLSFNTYSDIIFYLAAALLILRGNDIWLIPVTGLAVLNRETCALIPFMLLAGRLHPRKRTFIMAAIAMGVYLAVFAALRWVLGPRPLFPYSIPPGPRLFIYNMTSHITWGQLLATLGIVPVLALVSMRQWPPALNTFFWVIVPIWFAAHFFTAFAVETRYFLVPQALVFVPGALCGMAHWSEKAVEAGR